MVFFDVVVDSRLPALQGDRGSLTSALEGGLFKLPGIDLMAKSQRDTFVLSKKMTIADCDKEECRAAIVTALSQYGVLDLSLEATVTKVGQQCEIKLTVKDLKTKGYIASLLTVESACELNELRQQIAAAAANIWPPEKAKGYQPASVASTGFKTGGFGLGGAVPQGALPTVKEVGGLAAGLKQGAALSLEVDPDVTVAYYAALEADGKGKEMPEAAAVAWETLAKQAGNNPYKRDAQKRAAEWTAYAQQKTAAEKAAAERAEALRVQREQDDIKVSKLLGITNMPVEQKVALLKEYAGIYGLEYAVLVATLSVKPEVQLSELAKAMPGWEQAQAKAKILQQQQKKKKIAAEVIRHGGLMWQRTSPAERYTWSQAKAYCENLTLGGYSDLAVADN